MLDRNGVDPNHLNLTTTNSTLIAMQRKYCKLGECPISWATISYLPNLGGNVVYLACFFVLLGIQMFFGIKHKTWTFLGSMIMGLLLEIIGYIGRIMLHNNPFIMNNFLVYLICLTIGPAFFSGCIYLCLGRIITVVGPENSRLQPRTYAKIFIGCDLFALVLQAVGGALASTAKDHAGSQQGTNVMIAGLVSQVISMVLFMALWLDFTIRVRKAKAMGSLGRSQPPLYNTLRNSRIFTGFQLSLVIATVLIFIRCIYRVAELAGGFDSAIANSEVSFMIFEGPMIIIAVALITWFHPGRVFRQLWVPAGKGDRLVTKGMKPMHSNNGSDVQLGSEIALSEGEQFRESWRAQHQRA